MTIGQPTLNQWLAEARRNAKFREDGLPSENLLRVFLETIKRADLTLPEIEPSYFRRPHAGNEIGIDAWGVEDDETVGDEPETARAIRLHVVAFVHSDTTDEATLTSRAIEDAIYRAEQFVLQSAISGRAKALYEEIADSSTAADAAEYIYRNYQSISEIALHIVSDLPIDASVNIELTSPPRRIGNAQLHPEVLGVEQLFQASLQLQEPENSDVVLDLVAIGDEGQEFGHPVTAVGVTGDWEVYVTAFTGTQLVRFYEKYKLRLVNENVRAFLQFKGATNKGIRATIEEEPDQFISYNNGISIVARSVTGASTIAKEGDESLPFDQLYSIEGAQIVNGGQTTAALYHASQDPLASRNIDAVRVFAKITVLPNENEDMREAAIAKIARFANSQNSIKSSDLESNWGYFRDLASAAEKCPVPADAHINSDTIWFFERSRGRFAETKQINGAAWLASHPENQVIDKTLLADIMNCVSERPFDAQKGGEGLIKNYLRWLRPRNRANARHRDQTPRGFAFFGDNQLHAPADHDDLEQEWQGVVASVIVRRKLEEVFAGTEGWMRTIQIRYVLALAYTAFAKDDWLEIWRKQNIETYYKDLLAGRSRIQPTFADWAQAAGDVVKQRILKVSRDQGTAINDIAKQRGTWLPVFEAARKKGLI
jgi:hypothetical protein